MKDQDIDTELKNGSYALIAVPIEDYRQQIENGFPNTAIIESEKRAKIEKLLIGGWKSDTTRFG